MPMVIGNMAAAHLAITYGIKGPSLTVNTACSAGGDALMSAAFLIMSGQAEAVITMGGIHHLRQHGIFPGPGAGLSRRNESPAQASRPLTGTGTALSLAKAGSACCRKRKAMPKNAARGSLPFFRVLATPLDAYHVTAPDPTGAGAARSMRIAL